MNSLLVTWDVDAAIMALILPFPLRQCFRRRVLGVYAKSTVDVVIFARMKFCNFASALNIAKIMLRILLAGIG